MVGSGSRALRAGLVERDMASPIAAVGKVLKIFLVALLGKLRSGMW